MTDQQKLEKHLRRPAFLAHAGDHTKTFTDLGTALTWAGGQTGPAEIRQRPPVPGRHWPTVFRKCR